MKIIFFFCSFSSFNYRNSNICYIEWPYSAYTDCQSYCAKHVDFKCFRFSMALSGWKFNEHELICQNRIIICFFFFCFVFASICAVGWQRGNVTICMKLQKLITHNAALRLRAESHFSEKLISDNGKAETEWILWSLVYRHLDSDDQLFLVFNCWCHTLSRTQCVTIEISEVSYN